MAKSRKSAPPFSSAGGEAEAAFPRGGRALRGCAAGWVAAWTALSAARQTFDLVGKLWALVLVDLLQLLVLLSGLFALCHPPPSPRRPLCALLTFCALSIAHNVAILLWFCTDLLVRDHRQNDLLSLGLPFGHSFFLRHSPLCAAQFNLTALRWEQQTPCIIPYSHLEGAQAVLHALMALGTMVLTVCLLVSSSRNGGTTVEEYGAKRGAPPFSMVGAAGGGGVTTGTMSSGNGDILSSSGGYMDPSCCYEETLRHSPAAAPPLRRGYPRAGRRASTGLGERRRAAHMKSTASVHAVPVLLHHPHDHFSSLSTAGATDCGAAPLPPAYPPPPLASSAIFQPHQQSSSRSASSTGSRSTRESGSIGDRLIRSGGGDAHYQQQQSSASARRLYAGGGGHYYARPKACGSASASARSSSAAGAPPAMRTFGGGAAVNENVAAEISSSFRSGGALMRRDDDARRSSGALAAGNCMTSLISFDPKSATLIRVREHRRASSSVEGDAEAEAEKAAGADGSGSAVDGGDNNNSTVAEPMGQNTCSSTVATAVSSASDLPPPLPRLLPRQQQPLRHRVAPPPPQPSSYSSSGPTMGYGSAVGVSSYGQQCYGIGISLEGSGGEYGGGTAKHNGYSMMDGRSLTTQQNNHYGIQLVGSTVVVDDDGQRQQGGGTAPQPPPSAATAPLASSASIYEAYVGAAVPLRGDASCTAFPALRGAQPAARRSLMIDCSAASAIRLSRSDLRDGDDSASGAGDCAGSGEKS